MALGIVSYRIKYRIEKILNGGVCNGKAFFFIASGSGNNWKFDLEQDTLKNK